MPRLWSDVHGRSPNRRREVPAAVRRLDRVKARSPLQETAFRPLRVVRCGHGVTKGRERVAIVAVPVTTGSSTRTGLADPDLERRDPLGCSASCLTAIGVRIWKAAGADESRRADVHPAQHDRAEADRAVGITDLVAAWKRRRGDEPSSPGDPLSGSRTSPRSGWPRHGSGGHAGGRHASRSSPADAWAQRRARRREVVRRAAACGPRADARANSLSFDQERGTSKRSFRAAISARRRSWSAGSTQVAVDEDRDGGRSLLFGY